MGKDRLRKKNESATKGGSLLKSREARPFSGETARRAKGGGTIETEPPHVQTPCSEVSDPAPLRVLEQWRESLLKRYATSVETGEPAGSARGVDDGRCAPEIKPLLSSPQRQPAAGATSFFEPSKGRIPKWKRVLDIILVLVSVPVWLPIMLVTAILIRIVSPGPAFYRQERVGQNGRRFMIFKFRSMEVDCDTHAHEHHVAQLISSGAPMSKLDAHDNRIIRGGRLLRASGLDELPQLFNVLRGEMSLVGPRPCTVKEFERYQPWQCERVSAAPGLTGFWQVEGKNKTTFPEMMRMDIYYTNHVSLKLDLNIILRTFPVLWEQALSGRRSKSSRDERKQVALQRFSARHRHEGVKI